MAKTQHNKLVRDGIPEIIRADGRDYEIALLSDAGYERALREKLIEEAREAADAEGDEFIMEVADLYEVLDSLLALKGIDAQTVRGRQQQKQQERGGFEKRFHLLWTEAKAQPDTV